MNPCSLVLSAVMMLEYLGWQEAADLIVIALVHSFEDGRATAELAGFMPGGEALSTSAVTREIMERLGMINL